MQNTALCIANGCTKSPASTHLHAETKVLLNDLLNLRGTQIFSTDAVPAHPLHKFTEGQISLDNIALSLRINPFSLEWSERLWLQKSVAARTLAIAPHDTLQRETPHISSDKVNLYRQDLVHLARLRCWHHLVIHAHENLFHPIIDSVCIFCEHDSEIVPYTQRVSETG